MFIVSCKSIFNIFNNNILNNNSQFTDSNAIQPTQAQTDFCQNQKSYSIEQNRKLCTEKCFAFLVSRKFSDFLDLRTYSITSGQGWIALEFLRNPAMVLVGLGLGPSGCPTRSKATTATMDGWISSLSSILYRLWNGSGGVMVALWTVVTFYKKLNQKMGDIQLKKTLKSPVKSCRSPIARVRFPSTAPFINKLPLSNMFHSC